MNNPFTPVFGTIPRFPAGREDIINEMKKAFINWTGSPDITSILIGPRGSGKTALLQMIADEAGMEGWMTFIRILSEKQLTFWKKNPVDGFHSLILEV